MLRILLGGQAATESPERLADDELEIFDDPEPPPGYRHCLDCGCWARLGEPCECGASATC